MKLTPLTLLALFIAPVPADMPWEFQNKGVTLKMMIRIDFFIFALLILACCSLNRYIDPDQLIITIHYISLFDAMNTF